MLFGEVKRTLWELNTPRAVQLPAACKFLLFFVFASSWGNVRQY